MTLEQWGIDYPNNMLTSTMVFTRDLTTEARWELWHLSDYAVSSHHSDTAFMTVRSSNS